MNKKMKKVFSLTLVIGLGVGMLFLSGCGKTESADDIKEKAKIEKSDVTKDASKKEKPGSKSKKTTIKKKVSDNKKQPSMVHNNIKNKHNNTKKSSNLNSGKRKAVKPVIKTPAPRKKHTVVKGKTKWKRRIKNDSGYAEGGGKFDWPKDWN